MRGTTTTMESPSIPTSATTCGYQVNSGEADVPPLDRLRDRYVAILSGTSFFCIERLTLQQYLVVVNR